MKEKTTDRVSSGAKNESQQNPNQPRFTQAQTDSKQAPQKNLKTADKEAAVQQPKPSAPPASSDPTPKVDAHLKVARQETAQEIVHEVMTKHEASKLVSKDKPEQR